LVQVGYDRRVAGVCNRRMVRVGLLLLLGLALLELRLLLLSA
jgi:hypothetical protein